MGKISTHSLVQESLNHLVQTEPRVAMMVHVKSVLIGLIEMIVHRTLTKHGKDTMMLSQEHIAEHFFALELFLLHRLRLIAELGHNAVNEIEIH